RPLEKLRSTLTRETSGEIEVPAFFEGTRTRESLPRHAGWVGFRRLKVRFQPRPDELKRLTPFADSSRCISVCTGQPYCQPSKHLWSYDGQVGYRSAKGEE